jgi:hypothetical protein
MGLFYGSYISLQTVLSMVFSIFFVAVGSTRNRFLGISKVPATHTMGTARIRWSQVVINLKPPKAIAHMADNRKIVFRI